MNTQQVNFSSLYFGTPVAIISSQNADGTTNLSPVSSWWILGKSIVFGLGKSGKCYENLQQNADIVLNIPDASLWEYVEAMADTTGKEHVPDIKRKMGYRSEKNKFLCSDLTEVNSLDVGPGRIKECPVQIEARVVRGMPLGEYTEEMISMEARIIRTHISEKLLSFNDGKTIFNVEEWKPLYYIFRHYFSSGEHLGKNFRSNK
ncbi:flavin reductase family protein [Salmonella enterica]|uniref:Flavin reductase family protein n=2 Tax=Salmonella enterica I TaxID=59201 RepID=A0A3Y9C2Y7_SALEB|nr:flavin reductase family protein [Salmonella enterica]EAB8478347.1 flavin reductase family protein [Salmonella enterica subsp. enterica serovar Java]EBW8396750.1 flavin reductase family protein [Salmonella enterica subsp. enterica serovar Florida]HCM8926169.1 flavin reductase family protein [Salmonella enterica subsp. enterica serovar Paratyphi B]EAV3944950.1 flavin reductase family protein [Salmonella enterica]ECD7241486.1 flavin reductase family protein [Salmonella enterica subsp. enterica